MEYAEDLLDLARSIAEMKGESPRQASLRRAVSTAYYALFHLLISEATSNWGRAELRPALGRIFEHGKMKNASQMRVGALNGALTKSAPGSSDRAVWTNLHVVASTFVQLHQKREEADYNVATEWTPTEVRKLIDAAAGAFESWKVIRDEPEAQAYLVSLLGKQVR